MKKAIILIVSIVYGLTICLHGQKALPYFNNFDSSEDSVGWSHYALSGTDNWAIGVPKKNNFNAAYSSPNAWVTDLDTSYTINSEMVLVTPYFDLRDTSISYVLSFYHKKHTSAIANYYYLEYSKGKGGPWQLLDNVNAGKISWQNSNGFSGNYYTSFLYSAFELRFIQGQDSIRFRFRFHSNSSIGEGWMIDNFKIDKENTNIYAINSDSIFVSQHCLNYTLKTSLNFNNQFSKLKSVTTNYYFSKDSQIDATDSLIGTKKMSIYGIIMDWSLTLPVLTGLSPGNYYIIYKHDALNGVREIDETDNIGYAVLHVDTVYNLPYIRDFENNSEDSCITYLGTSGKTIVWELGEGYRHRIQGTHSGKKAWHTSKSIDFNYANCTSSCNLQYVASPYIDLTTDTGNLVMNVWFKNKMDGNAYSIEAGTFCGKSLPWLISFPACRDNEWDFINVPLNNQKLSNNFRFRISYYSSTVSADGIIFDDVYLGTVKPDLSIERNKIPRFSPSSLSSDTLIYYLNNSGLAIAPPTISAFYWSSDSVFDTSDILLGTKTENTLDNSARVWNTFQYTKPTIMPGRYFIFYVLDTSHIIDEMREYNNIGYFTLYQQNLVNIPYFNDFETQIDGWSHNATVGNDDWQWTTPKGKILNKTFSGEKAWITNDSGLVSPMSRMHLYTPIFDLSKCTNPVLEFDMKLNSDQSCYCFEGKMNLSYSLDGGVTWTVLDTASRSYNRWYYPMNYESNGGYDKDYNMNYTELLFGRSEKAFVAYNQYNSRNSNRNTRYILDIGFLTGRPCVQFRFNLGTLYNSSKSSNAAVEGALIDNFSIRESLIDLNVNYMKSLMISALSKEVKFSMNVINQGNYIAKPCIVKYYVSNDTKLDSSDFYLGQENITEIRPDMNFFVNVIFSAPANLENYNFLIYELDANNTNIEFNESNNIGFWNLALDSISSYPYFNNFNDTIIDGWNHYVKDKNGNHLKSGYRFRNIVLSGEPIYQSALKSGEMFTDRINSTMSISQVPYWYLETPVFNFSKTDSILLSFDLMCSGRTYSLTDGGNMEFSLDGGNSWTILTNQYGNATNWYNYQILESLNNEPGWTGPPAGYALAVLNPTTFDLSFLKSKKSVIFRYKYRSNWEYFGSGTVQGMRIDNFRIDGYSVDYRADNEMDEISANINPPDFNVHYSITNIGQITERKTVTKFFWSKDSIFDNSDSLIYTFSQSPISPGATFNSTISISYPKPVVKSNYYLFYVTDADSYMVEISELNNVGGFKITFDYFDIINHTFPDVIDMYVKGKNLYIDSQDDISYNTSTLRITNMKGQIIYSSDILLKKGLNIYPILNNVSSGVYLISIYSKKDILIRKITIQN